MTLIELVVVIVVILILVGLLLPVLVAPHHPHHRDQCVNNLKQIGLSFRLWSGDNGDRFPMQVSISETNGGTKELIAEGNVFPHFHIMSNELSTPRILICPEDKGRKAATSFETNFNDDNISYFVGVDADESKPTTILSGDRNLALGKTPLGHGLVTLTNGSPISWTSQIHKGNGYIALGDGSVLSTDIFRLQKFFRDSGLTTNRLVIP